MPNKKRSASPPEKQVAPSTSAHPRINFIKSVKFVAIGLDKTNAFVDRSRLVPVRENEGALEISLRVDYSVLTHEPVFFVVQAEFDLALQSQKSTQAIVAIQATFSAKFNLLEPASDDLVRAFSQVEARLVFFPYLRQYVSDLSYRMSIDPIVLPLTSELEK